jgi:hypothetical protein
MDLLVESQYLPPVTLLKISIEFSNIKFDIYEHYRKMSFRNRCMVAGANGPILLSVPLQEGREQRKPMREVLIDNKKPWQAQHWKTITSCYNRSPWFDFFCDELAELYRQPFRFLVDWNRTCFDWVTSKMGIPLTTDFTENYQPSGEVSGCLDLRNRMMPRSIEKDFPGPVKYRQVFEERTGFVPHLSVLDLLFCEGKNALRILKGQ